MFDEGEVVRVLTAGIMDLLPEGGKIVIHRDLTTGPPEDERFCVQVDARDPERYTLRVVPLTDKQRRQITGRTEGVLRSMIPADWDIKINHYRMCGIGNALPKHRALRYGFTIEPLGGFTEVMIQSPDGEECYVAQAKCHPGDNFCRAEGRVIALDRAVRKMQDAQADASLARFDASVAKLPDVTSEDDPEAESPFPPMDLLIAGGYPDGFSGGAGAQS